jgi:large subunit ribosomal protein L21
MYAVIESGGKQYRVEVGTELEVDLLDVEPGQEINLERVLLVADGDESAIGTPIVADAAVSAEVVRRARGEKLISFKYKPKARSRVKKGHRSELTVLRITDVRLGKKSAADEKRQADAAAKTERERLQEAAATGRRGRRARREAREAVEGKTDEKPATRRRQRHDRQGRAGRREGPAKTGPGRRPPTPARRPRPRRPRRSRPKEDHPREEGRRADGPQESRFQLEEQPRQRRPTARREGRRRQLVTAGSIIVRQRGQTFLSGPGTGLGHDSQSSRRPPATSGSSTPRRARSGSA